MKALFTTLLLMLSASVLAGLTVHTERDALLIHLDTTQSSRTKVEFDLNKDGSISITYDRHRSITVSSSELRSRMIKAARWVDIAKKNKVESIAKQIDTPLKAKFRWVNSIGTYTVQATAPLLFKNVADNYCVVLMDAGFPAKENKYVKSEAAIIFLSEETIRTLAVNLERKNLEQLWKGKDKKEKATQDLFQ
jgi:hypothetical protein